MPLETEVVAQLVRASVCGTEGRGFEPHLPPRKRKESMLSALFLFSIIFTLTLTGPFKKAFFFFNVGNERGNRSRKTSNSNALHFLFYLEFLTLYSGYKEGICRV